MSTEAPTGKKTTGPTRDEPPEKRDLLVERIETLEDIVSNQSKEITKLEETVEKQNDQLEKQTDEVDELSTEIENLEERLDHGEKKDGHLTTDIVDIENQLTELSQNATAVNGDDPKGDIAMLPIERIRRLGAENTEIEITPSIERAVTIFEHWPEWASKTRKGLVLKKNQKTLLRTATDENLTWRQVYRACNALQQLSKQQIIFRKHNKHGWMLVERNPQERTHCQSSSAISG